MATSPTISYPSSSAPQGAGTSVIVSANSPIKWQTGNSIKWTTGNPIRWIKNVETVAELSEAGSGSTPKTVYTGASEP